ncbi:MAG: SPFH domain-containing protein [Planctomycetota bacterium]
MAILAQSLFDFGFIWVVLAILGLLIVFSLVVWAFSRFRRCPSNKVLVVYGRTRGQQAAKCVHGGLAFIVPLIQDFAYMSLEPITIEIELTSALSKKNIRVAVPSTFTIGISTEPTIMNNAAERLLGLNDREIATQARDIILGQMRLVIATLTIEEINQDREKFLDLVNKNVNFELNKIGLYMINVNIRDITDESGYIDALGQKAAAEAINQAKIDTAQAEREGAIGTAAADRERTVKVAEETALADIGRKEAERNQRIKVAALEAEGIAGEADARRQQEIAVATQGARAAEGKKQAESEQRVKVAGFEAEAVDGENTSRAEIAKSEATLSERQAEARRRGEVAAAEAARDVLMAEKEQELARMQKEVIAKETIERQQVEISAEADAERERRVAKGKADAELARYTAEAEGIKKVLDAKADGYERLMAACAQRPDLAPSLLVIEQLPSLVAEQVKAIQNLQIDKITVWDGGSGGVEGQGSTAGFLRGLIGALPPVHELAEQAGIDLPDVLGKVERPAGSSKPTRRDPAPGEPSGG